MNHFVGFIPPVVGIEGEFNTFRLGGFYYKRLKETDIVYLVDEKNKLVIGTALVRSIYYGELTEMCILHGYKNHSNLVKHSDNMEPPERLFKLITKIYGPHIVKPNSLVTVIEFERI